MLQSLTDGLHNSKVLRWIVIAIIAVPFALFGISSYLGNSVDENVAVVNGTEINLYAYQREYSRERQRMAQSFGGRIPPSLAQGDFIQRQTLNNMIQRELLLQTTTGNGYRLGKESLAEKVTAYEAFHVEGKFDPERYQRHLQSQGMSAAQFEQQIREATLIGQMSEAVANTAFLAPSQSKRLKQLDEQTRSFSVISFKTANFEAGIEVSEQDVLEYFEKNTSDFMYPEAVKLEYLDLNVAMLSQDVEVPEEAIQAEYEAQKQNFMDQEQRKAAHILLKLSDEDNEEKSAAREQEIQALLTRIQNGEDFAELAKEVSEDPGSARQGGDLGNVQRGIMVKPFEEALFSMQAGEVSDPIRTAFGWHLIKLEKITAPEQKPFEAVRDDLVAEYKNKQADKQFFNVLDDLSNESYENNETLSIAAERTGLVVQESEWIERTQGPGIGEYAEVRQAAFSSPVFVQGINSDVTEVGDNHVIVLRLKEVREAEPKNLAEVEEQIQLQIKSERAKAQAQAAAAEALAALQAGEDLQAVSERFNAELNRFSNSKRNARQPDTQTVSTVFSLAKPSASNQSSYEQIDSANASSVIILEAVQQPEPGMPPEPEPQVVAETEEEGAQEEDTPSKIDANLERRLRTLGRGDYNAWLESVREKSDIVRREDLISSQI